MPIDIDISIFIWYHIKYKLKGGFKMSTYVPYVKVIILQIGDFESFIIDERNFSNKKLAKAYAHAYTMSNNNMLALILNM